MINIFISIIPLIVWSSHFEVSKVFAFLILGTILIFSLIINVEKITFTKRDYYYLLWLVTLLISGLFGLDSKIAILGGSYRHQGLIFFLCLYLLIKYIEILTAKQKENLYKGVGVVVLIESILVILGFKLGTIGEINAVSGFLAMGSYFIKTSFPKLLLIIPAIGMLINLSKSAILALIPYFFKKINIVFLIAVIALLFVIKPINNLSIFESRGVIWKHAISIIMEKPIFGHGAESNEVLYDKKFAEDSIILTGLMIDRAHNLFLDITIWSGLIGLFFFVMFLYESFKNLNFEKRQVFLSFLIYSMFQPLSVVHWILFALL
ncbi:MAG: O-antigen ligase family protein [Patescibacteria group bacterium]